MPVVCRGEEVPFGNNLQKKYAYLGNYRSRHEREDVAQSGASFQQSPLFSDPVFQHTCSQLVILQDLGDSVGATGPGYLFRGSEDVCSGARDFVTIERFQRLCDSRRIVRNYPATL